MRCTYADCVLPVDADTKQMEVVLAAVEQHILLNNLSKTVSRIESSAVSWVIDGLICCAGHALSSCSDLCYEPFRSAAVSCYLYGL